MRLLDLTGKKFSKLTVESEAGRDSYGRAQWLCVCDCGERVIIGSNNLRTGNSKSCGCVKRQWLESGKANRTHGMTKTGAHVSWRKMIERCEKTYCRRYADYGGRGIKVCDRWKVFENFYADMGDRPEGMSLDRIDVNGNYEPSNCRWATPQQQRANRRDS
jgi:hypothetical protein